MPRFCDSLRRLLSLSDCVCHLSLTRASLSASRIVGTGPAIQTEAQMQAHRPNGGWLVGVCAGNSSSHHPHTATYVQQALSTNVPDAAGLRQWLIQRWPLHANVSSLLILDDLNGRCCCCPRTAWPRDADVRRANMSVMLRTLWSFGFGDGVPEAEAWS
jgi:hypothetical protein